MPHLSQAIRSGSLLFVSGQLAFDDLGAISGDISDQTRLALQRMATVLADHGLTLAHVVKAGVWLTDATDFPAFDAAFAAVFGDHKPTRSTVISGLALPTAKVEIDCIASFDMDGAA